MSIKITYSWVRCNSLRYLRLELSNTSVSVWFGSLAMCHHSSHTFHSDTWSNSYCLWRWSLFQDRSCGNILPPICKLMVLGSTGRWDSHSAVILSVRLSWADSPCQQGCLNSNACSSKKSSPSSHAELELAWIKVMTHIVTALIVALYFPEPDYFHHTSAWPRVSQRQSYAVLHIRFHRHDGQGQSLRLHNWKR